MGRGGWYDLMVIKCLGVRVMGVEGFGSCGYYTY